ncbi:MAG: hypothetical protein QNL90_19650 [Gammaproteobacteria bacterium]|nr:hypothetical protein [Gammaproteobacteria bacterium]MDX2462373.1 hypothetical protein [Gammaproteobacteria bacterium]
MSHAVVAADIHRTSDPLQRQCACLNKMRKMGLVERLGGTLVVHDVTAIEHFIQGSRGQIP